MAAARTGNARDSVLGADINSFGHGISKLYKLTFDYTGSLERAAITRRANELPRDNPRRMAFLASADCRYSNQLLQGTPIEALRFTVRSPEQVRRASESLPAHRWAPHHEPRQEHPAAGRCLRPLSQNRDGRKVQWHPAAPRLHC